MRVLIFGGYGVFGGRLVELLGNVGGLELLVVGRHLQPARAFCDRVRAGPSGPTAAKLTPIAASRADVDHLLVAHQPDVVVDASGPFQHYGAAPYAVVEACISHAVHYLDLADGAEFVAGISQFDTQAKAAGVVALSGVSSFPVLTAAVIDEASKRFRVRSVECGIAPSPFAGVGLNVVRAVLGYAGERVRLRRGGRFTVAPGLAESRRYTVAPPGQLPLRSLRFSLVDVPDLTVLPQRYPAVDDIWVGAGPVPVFLHRLLNALAIGRFRLRLPSMTPLARIGHWVINHARYGEHRGGMYLELHGDTPTGQRQLSWHLLAEGDDGPYIPSMAVEAIIKKMHAGGTPATGARAAAGELTLDDYTTAFAGRHISSGFRSGELASTNLFEEALAEKYADLPVTLRQLHGGRARALWTGSAMVQGAETLAARLVARMFGFPAAAARVPVRVEIRAEQGPAGTRETWVRQFGAQRFESRLSPGRGREQYLVCEQFGVVTVALALVWDGQRLWFVPRRWRVGWLPLPQMLLPAGRSFETDEDSVFAFDVSIEMPFVGRIARYRGTLKPDRISTDVE
ncbi:MAG: DUF4166 domain-containing protein [Pseudomonadota bacterium]